MGTKLTSRKFWLAVAAFLASLGTSITGFATDEPVVTWVGIICTTISAAIYAASEAYVDGKAAAANITTTASTTNVNATTTSTQAVEKIINKDTQPIAEVPKTNEVK